MTDAKNDSRHKEQTQPWIIERMLHRAQPHITEQRNPLVGPWFIIAGIIVLMVVTAFLLFMWTGQVLGIGSTSNTPGVSKTVPSGTLAPATVTRSAATPGVAATVLLQTPLPPPPTATVAPPPPSATPSAFKYKVKTGDTLLEIAIRYGVSVQAIQKANGMKNDVIRIGDELIIPAPPH
jgi:LysM repeat protein